MNRKIVGAVAIVALLAAGGAIAINMANKNELSSNQVAVDSDKHNSQDVMFAQMMIPHHEQAVEMAALAETRANNPEVKKLAADIKGAQDPEIKTMTSWLQSWGEETDIPTSMDHGMSGHDMGATVSGMMSAEDMEKLKGASGVEFDKMFMTMMIQHHQGAIDMARNQIQGGQYGPAIQMAKDIEAAQTREIEKMNQLLVR